MPSTAGTLQKALKRHQSGNLCEARRLYWRILAAEPGNADALHLLGVAAHQTGRHEEAAEKIRKAIRIDAGRAEFHKDLGEVLAALERFDEAETCLQEAVRLRPDYAEAHNSLGLIFQRRNQFGQALDCFARAARLRPDFAEPYNHTGIIAHAKHQPQKAEACFQKAIQLDPAYAAAHSNLGIVYLSQEKFSEAAPCFQEALRLNPRYASAHNNLGILHQLRGEAQQARRYFDEAIRLEPKTAQFHNNLANLLRSQQRLPEALSCYQKALQLNPELAEARANLGQLLAEQAHQSAAVAGAEQAIAQAPSDALKLLSLLTLPEIAESLPEVQRQRRRFEDDLTRLENENLVIDDPVRQVSTAGTYYLSYQGMNDRPLMVRLASLFLRATPSLRYTAPPCVAPAAPDAGRRLRIGFLSRSFYSHSVGRLTAGLIRQLSRQQFHVTVFTSDVPEDAWCQRIRDGADAVVRLPSPASPGDPLAEARRIIGGENLDVLYFADIVMDPWAYFLAFSRLAPVQCTSWGHPITTGIPTIDYYLSARGLEMPDAADHYSERLVIFDNLPSYFYRLPAPEGELSRRHFGLEEDAHLYVCAQSLFKLHPELDSLFDGILRADPRGRIVLIAGHREYWTKILLNRLSGVLGEKVKRVIVLPRQSGDDFRHLLNLADVALDPVHFGSGVTAYETLALGTPLVTLPSRFMRGRIVYSCYQRMDIMDCVAADADDYVRLAVRLGNDPAWRADIRRRILAANGVLFENPGIIHELEQFFLTARRRPSPSAEVFPSCR